LAIGKSQKSFYWAPLLALAGLASAQCPQNDGQVVGGLKAYPRLSDNYAVQYQIGGGAWTTAAVYISYYGQTTGSPYRNVSPYTAGTTSMSFASIPTLPNASVQLRVTKLFGTPFQASDHVSVRPSVKSIGVTTGSDGTVEISTLTASNFAGEQFILWWNRGTDGGGVEGLAFFLNPPYTAPVGNNVKVVKSWSDLISPSSPVNALPIDTLDFEGQVELGNTGKAVYPVPANIVKIFLGPSAWVQGKFSFPGSKSTTTIYGPGVLDGSLFDYLRRDCSDDNGSSALGSSDVNGNLNHLIVDGIIISDHNHTATDPMYNTTLNNVKTISWNSNNDGLRFKDSTTATNVFVRSGDDSLMIWGSAVTVTNATVWQNYNGGVVNLGWLNNSPGDNGLLDGLYVVKTDWITPTANQWTAEAPGASGSTLNSQNNGVFVSLMTPATSFGQISPPVYKNIFVEDQPQVLLSLKIVPPVNCPATGTACSKATLLQPSSVSLNIENLYSPAPLVASSIGFQTLPNPYTTQTNEVIAGGYTLSGAMSVNLTNVVLTPPNGTAAILSSANASSLAKMTTNGANVSIAYAGPCVQAISPGGQVFSAAGGNGTIGIVAPQGCPWAVLGLPPWIVLTSASSGTGNGTVMFQVLPNNGSDVSASITIGGQAFLVEQQAASIPGLNYVGSMPHVAAEENWTSTFTFVNKSVASATVRLSLFGDAGDPSGNGPLMLPLAFPQQSSVGGSLLAASLDQTITANASLLVTTAGSQTPPVLVGSAQLSGVGAVDGFAIFHLIPGSQEAVVPMETRNAGSYLLAFDNTGGVVLGVAVANVSAQAGTVGIVLRDDTGSQIGSGSLPMQASGHASFVLSSQFPATANKRGTIEFDTPAGGQISVLGIRTTPLGGSTTLTTIPALANVGTSGGSIAHIATGNGWQTTFVLVNTGATVAQANLKFFADVTGSPLALPISFPQTGSAVSTVSSLTQTLAPGATLLVQSAAPLSNPTPTSGSAQLSTNGKVGGFVIFRYNPNGQEAVVPLESRTANGFLIAFDNTAGTATGIAINSVSSAAVNVPVILRDDAGNQIATDTLNIAVNGHLAFTLVADKYPGTANLRGTIEFDTPPGAQIGALGIRIPVAHTFTTLPALAK
jgi:hypothetical protein